MGKVRVYELAQKMGMENKDLLEKLRVVGIDAKSHMSVLEDEDVTRLEAASAPTVEKIEETRVTSGVIRRRRTEMPRSAADEEAAAAPAEEASAEAAPVEEPKKKTPQEPAAAEKVVRVPASGLVPVAETPPAVEAEADVEVESAVSETKGEAPAVEAEETPGAKKEVRVERATATKAKILGRVELPVARPAGRPDQRPGQRPGQRPDQRPGQRPDQRPDQRPGQRPDQRPDQRPARPARPGEGRFGRDAAPASAAIAPGQAPLGEKEVRGGKKHKKGKGTEYTEEAGRAAGRGRRDREVYEPERGGKLRRGKKAAKPAKKTEITISKAIKRIIRISDSITVGELAKRMGVKANDLIKELMRQGTMVTINHPLDYDTAALLASDFQYEVENVAFDEEAILEHASLRQKGDENLEDLKPRPPVVTIMGHVDHGKTSLLDAIRTTDVTAGEAGGITQHIGAYDVELDGRKITFLDTPGHEAFTSMRARGAQVTDVVILVVAADDGVMPQTKEAINHAKAAGVPIIVAINKVDKPDANPERVKQELTEFALVPEDWGGETIFVEVSAKQRTNLDKLLEMILLQADVLELKANPDKHARGTIVEARLDRGRGPVATVLVQEGTLKIGDPIVAGVHYGRVRSMTADRGSRVLEAGPSFPVEVTGLSGVPAAGDIFHAVEDEKVAKDVAQHRQHKVREVELAKTSKISLEQLYARIQQGEAKELKVIIKGDVQGSVEAVNEALTKLSTEACRLVVLHSAVGGITESDVSLASASDAIIVGFSIRPETKAAALADAEGVDIKLYNVIYDAVADVKNAMEGLLAPTLREKALGRAEVREVFSITKVGTIAGCYVLDGKVQRNAHVRLLRDNVVVWTGRMDSLKRFKEDAREVASGYECGIGLEKYNDIKVGDIIEAFEIEEIKTTL